MAAETTTMSRPRPSIPEPKTLRQEGLLDYAVHRLDYVATLLGCAAKELVDASDEDTPPEAPAILYLYEILRNEVENLRSCVERVMGRGGDR
jgi:hypothetical protein